MPQLFITSGTSYTLPADFNPANNSIECYGGGSPGNNSNGAGGAGGAYAKSTNVNIAAGSIVNIGIGTSGNTNTWFNATSLANAVSNGTSISCGAQGASNQTGGLASASCGSTKNSGGNGGPGNASAGSGGGGAGGPNGAGANGGSSGGASGGGGGGANNGTVGGGGSAPSGGNGGNGRLGSGGGIGGANGASSHGGNGTTGSGGGGGGGYTAYGGNGALDNVYSDGIHGPGGGGGGGGASSGNENGGNAGGFGGGAGGPGGGGYSSGLQTDGLIVITYVSAPAGFLIESPELPQLFMKAPIIGQLPRAVAPQIVTLPGILGWLMQPSALLPPAPKDVILAWPGPAEQPFPNPTPTIWEPFENFPDLQRHPSTLDTRQQFPGLAPAEFQVLLAEGADTVSSVVVPTVGINAASISEADNLVAFIEPEPVVGSSDDITNRVKSLLPKGWWKYAAPIRDAIIGGIADLAAWSYSLIQYAVSQSRLAYANGIWLDIISQDYFGSFLPRKPGEVDSSFRARIQDLLIQERVTRKGMIEVITDLTGTPPTVFEPWNTGDAGAWDIGNFAFDAYGGWGDLSKTLPAQSFLNVTPPGLMGIGGVGGWDTGYLAWDGGIGMWADMNLITGSVTDADIYAAINITRPTGSIVWTQLFPVAGPVPPPPQQTITPTFYPPGMIQPSMGNPSTQQPTMPLPQIGGTLATNPVTPSVAPPWLTSQPPAHRPAHEQSFETVGFGSALANNPVTPNFAPPWAVTQPPIHRPAHEQAWMPMDLYGARVSDPAALLPWLATLSVVQPNPTSYSVPVMPDSV